MDKSIAGWGALHKKDPGRTAQRIDAIIKDTYRTLMTRGQKGCYVYFVDGETSQYFKTQMRGVAEEPIPFVNALPLLTLRAAADSSYAQLEGYFSDSDGVEWVLVGGGPFPKDRFLVRAEGDSMQPMIQGGQLCIFRKDPGGSRNGKIVLCRIERFAGDAPVAVIKRYRSARTANSDSIGEAQAIVLSSLNERHEDIVVTGGDGLSIVGILDRVIPR